MCTTVVGGSIHRAARRISAANDQTSATPMTSLRTEDRRKPLRSRVLEGGASGFSVTFQNNSLAKRWVSSAQDRFHASPSGLFAGIIYKECFDHRSRPCFQKGFSKRARVGPKDALQKPKTSFTPAFSAGRNQMRGNRLEEEGNSGCDTLRCNCVEEQAAFQRAQCIQCGIEGLTFGVICARTE